MAQRIEQLANTATAPATDDYVPLDGISAGTRRLLASSLAVRVAVPANGSTPGLPGQYAIGGGYRFEYSGDGVTHSWIYFAGNQLP